MLSYDTETTGVDTHTDHIVTAAIVRIHPGKPPTTTQWVIDPGVDITTEASDIHGWTNERIAAETGPYEAFALDDGGEKRPLTRDAALFEIATFLGAAMGNGTPVIIANAPFDLTLTEAELVRNGIDTLTSRPAGIVGVVDPIVIEKQFDTYRKQCFMAPGCNPEDRHHECGGCRGGKYKCGGCGITDRTLSSLCKHYQLVHHGAHDASGDALAAARLVWRLTRLWPEIARWKLGTLHQHQITWKRDQADGLAKFFRRVGKVEEAASVSLEWPLQTTRLAVAS